jgi:hypothetical protein
MCVGLLCGYDWSVGEGCVVGAKVDKEGVWGRLGEGWVGRRVKFVGLWFWLFFRGGKWSRVQVKCRVQVKKWVMDVVCVGVIGAQRCYADIY